jgi:N-acetylglucosaminyl-diphospho-decaprenol L-rhamnosyltransferase
MSDSAHGRGTVGVVVVHFGDPAPTATCVRTLREDASSCARRIVVVDNSGTLSADALPGAEVLNAGGNLGFGAGANFGVRHLGAGPWEALVIFNHDVEVADGYLDAACEALAEDGVGAAAGPLYLDRPGGALWYAGGSVCFLTGTVRQSTSGALARRPRTVGFFPGAALAIRQQAWDDVGGFDPGYFLYNEDVDLCLRLRRRGYRLCFAPRMVAVHQLGAVTGSAGRSPFYLGLMAETRLRPFRPLLYRFYLAGLHSGYVLLRSLWLLAAGGAGREAARALLRGHAKALAGLGRGPLP